MRRSDLVPHLSGGGQRPSRGRNMDTTSPQDSTFGRSDVALAAEPLQGHISPDRRQVEGAEALGDGAANAVDSSTPIVIRPAERAASAAPIPPGTGIRLERTEAAVLTKTSCARFSSTP